MCNAQAMHCIRFREHTLHGICHTRLYRACTSVYAMCNKSISDSSCVLRLWPTNRLQDLQGGATRTRHGTSTLVIRGVRGPADSHRCSVHFSPHKFWRMMRGAQLYILCDKIQLSFVLRQCFKSVPTIQNCRSDEHHLIGVPVLPDSVLS